VEATKSLSDTWTGQGATAAYDLSVYGPQGFFRKFTGAAGAAAANLVVQTNYLASGGIQLVVTNSGPISVVTITDQYTARPNSPIVTGESTTNGT
jgi:phospholipase C